MLDALDAFPEFGLIFTGSNADPGAREIDALITAYVANRKNAVFHSSLGSRRYFSGLTHCDLVIGNSSSDCDPQPESVAAAIRAGLALDCSTVKNPYGDGHAAERIVSALAAVDRPEGLVRKVFVDISS